MADVVSPAASPEEGRTPPPQSVAGSNAPGQPASNPPAPPTVATVPLFGGKRGGKARADGLVPGSPEAIEADRRKDRERKAAARAVARTIFQPPPLPPPGKPAQAVVPATGNAPMAPTAVPMSGGGDPLGAVLPWTSEDMREIFDELVPAAEEELTGKLVAKAREAQLPPKMLNEIAKDAAWSATTKKGLIVGGSALSAKYLNKSGISSEYKPEVVFALALARVARSHMSLSRRLDDLIAEQRRANQQQQAQAKP